jgi:hypothetical protein
VVVDKCGYETVSVTADEFSFDGVPADVPAGTVAITMTNGGELEHEMAMFRVDDTVRAPVGELLQMSPSEVNRPLTFTSAAHAS